jgi:hypothetical protein
MESVQTRVLHSSPASGKYVRHPAKKLSGSADYMRMSGFPGEVVERQASHYFFYAGPNLLRDARVVSAASIKREYCDDVIATVETIEIRSTLLYSRDSGICLHLKEVPPTRKFESLLRHHYFYFPPLDFVPTHYGYPQCPDFPVS